MRARNGWGRCLAAGVLLATGMHAHAQASDVRAVPTYESIGVYWDHPGADPATGCKALYRRTGDAAWKTALDLWYDAASDQCRGSIVQLAPDTSYEIDLGLPGALHMRSLSVRTWANVKPVANVVSVPSGSGTLNITQGGSAAGYVVYQGEPGAVLDAGNAAQFNVAVNASYVIVRGLTLRGAQQDAIRLSPDVHDVIIEDNDISGWGRQRSGALGMDLDAAIRADCPSPTLERVTIQRNRIHEPRYGANSWSDGHPAGPQAVTFSRCGGNHVIRHNEIWSTDGHYYNDVLGGEDNFSTGGFPNYDSDIYGNLLSNCWDDAIESEGGDRNVRVWGNYIDNTTTGIATALASVGPFYAFRNVYNRSRELGSVPLDADARQELFKAGSDPSFQDGRRYLFHNTTLQARQAGANRTLGVAYGVSGASPTEPFNNTVSRNNLYHTWDDSVIVYRQPGTGNEFTHDMFNGVDNVGVVGGIHAAPTYQPGNGWESGAGGAYALQPGTPGYDGGVRIDNFNDDYAGNAPDVGAGEAGKPPMKFGIAASPGPAVAPPPPAHKARIDYNADGKGDLTWINAATGAQGVWLMDGTSAASYAAESAGAGFVLRLTGDFDGDGKTDLIYRDAGGTYKVQLMDGAGLKSEAVLLNGGTGWEIVGKGDFDGDGRTDLLWKAANGTYGLWLMNGTTFSSAGLFQAPGPGWDSAIVADFDGDGKSDILWQSTDGRVQMWLMNGFLSTAQADMVTVPNGWTPTFAGDFDGDGKADLLWKHTNGSIGLWLVNGTTITSYHVMLGAGSGWSVAGVGDLDGDGKSDIVLTHANGSVGGWIMDGANVMAYGAIGTPGLTPVAIDDFDGDGNADIAWKDATNAYSMTLMSGLDTKASGSLLPGGTAWHLVPQ